MLSMQVEIPDEAKARTEADSLWGMTDRKATAKTRATAGPSTAFVAKNAPNSAQDDGFCGDVNRAR
jgi:hypothetical protein